MIMTFVRVWGQVLPKSKFLYLFHKLAFVAISPPQTGHRAPILINRQSNWRRGHKNPNVNKSLFQWHLSKLPFNAGQSETTTCTTSFDVFAFLVLSWYLESLLVDEWVRLWTPPAPGLFWLFYISSFTQQLPAPIKHPRHICTLLQTLLCLIFASFDKFADLLLAGRQWSKHSRPWVAPIPLFVPLLPPSLFLSRFFTTLWFCQMRCCMPWGKVKSFCDWLFCYHLMFDLYN